MNIFFAMKKIIAFLDNCTLWWPIAPIEKKLSKSRKKFGIQKKFQIQKKKKKKLWNREKKIMESKKKKKSKKYFGIEKKFQNRVIYFRIKKTISKLRKMFQNREIFCYKNREKNLWNWMFSQHFCIIALLHAYVYV